MKRKFLLPILSVCMVVALVSVGFAAWLITGSDTTDTAQGSFVTKGARNEFFTVTVDPYDSTAGAKTTTEPKIVFGKPSGYTKNSTDWFAPGDDVDTQSFDACFLVTITPDDTNFLKKGTGDDAPDGILEKYEIKVTLKEKVGDSGVQFDGLTTKNKSNIGTKTKTESGKTLRDGEVKANCAYIEQPTFQVSTYTNYAGNATMGTATSTGDGLTGGYVLTIKGANFKVNEDGASASCIIKITFAWGDYFTFNNGADDEIVNPYVYFNKFDSKDATSVTIGEGDEATTTTQGALNRKAAYDVMEAIKALNDDVKFELTLAANEIIKTATEE